MQSTTQELALCGAPTSRPPSRVQASVPRRTAASISRYPEVREPDKVDRWDWYAIDALPSPLFAMLPSAIAMLIDERPLQRCQDAP